VELALLGEPGEHMAGQILQWPEADKACIVGVVSDGGGADAEVSGGNGIPVLGTGVAGIGAARSGVGTRARHRPDRTHRARV
jgi:hypothetical protein